MLTIARPIILPVLFPGLTWGITNHHNKQLYLTFDDGPVPDVTPWVLSTLKEYNASATFFCVGNNVKKYPDVFKKIKQEGHAIGNHTFNHAKGLFSSTKGYIQDIEKAAKYIDSSLFRPPHGLIKPAQVKALKRKKYKIIMWNVLSRDYNQKLSGEKCLSLVVKHAKAGSIIVFHDSYKAEKNLRYALPKVLEYFSNKGYRFSSMV